MSRLNIAGTWEARHIPPGTPYLDEPAETIPAGWWVIAYNEGETTAQIQVDVADADGRDVSEQVARIIAKALDTAANPRLGLVTDTPVSGIAAAVPSSLTISTPPPPEPNIVEAMQHAFRAGLQHGRRRR